MCQGVAPAPGDPACNLAAGACGLMGIWPPARVAPTAREAGRTPTKRQRGAPNSLSACCTKMARVGRGLVEVWAYFSQRDFRESELSCSGLVGHFPNPASGGAQREAGRRWVGGGGCWGPCIS